VRPHGPVHLLLEHLFKSGRLSFGPYLQLIVHFALKRREENRENDTHDARDLGPLSLQPIVFMVVLLITVLVLFTWVK
jgi:hypothetical protein